MSVATVGESVAAALRQEIVERRLEPGDRIRQEEVARRLGVSVIPVREALRVLEGEGQVTYSPRQGYSVARLDLGELRETYRLRELLEAEAVRAALPRLEDEHLDAIEQAFAATDEALRANDVATAMTANRRAHFALFEASGMPILVRHIRMLWDSTQAYRGLYYAEQAATVRDEHREILDALRRRDADAVLELLDAHRRGALDALARVL
jgi:DNA-binding GntR family transcriptional regulator